MYNCYFYIFQGCFIYQQFKSQFKSINENYDLYQLLNICENEHCNLVCFRNVLDFYQHVHPTKELRDASTTAAKKLAEFEVDLSMRQDIYDRYNDFIDTGN